MRLTYPVSEDTLLLKRNVEELDLAGKTFLEVGTGSGEIAISAAGKGAEVTAVDRNPEAVEKTEERAEKEDLEIEVVESDLLEDVDGSFDVIVFNPPYLPGERRDENDALVGGEKGTELTENFLEQAKDRLNYGGEIYFIASSLADLESLNGKYDLEKVDEESLWFEKLLVYRLSAC